MYFRVHLRLTGGDLQKSTAHREAVSDDRAICARNSMAAIEPTGILKDEAGIVPKKGLARVRLSEPVAEWRSTPHTGRWRGDSTSPPTSPESEKPATSEDASRRARARTGAEARLRLGAPARAAATGGGLSGAHGGSRGVSRTFKTFGCPCSARLARLRDVRTVELPQLCGAASARVRFPRLQSVPGRPTSQSV